MDWLQDYLNTFPWPDFGIVSVVTFAAGYGVGVWDRHRTKENS